jgi:hypothetical protein
MNSGEHSKIVEPSWSGRVDVPTRPIIFPNTSARLPPANVPTWPANPLTIARARRAGAKNPASRSRLHRNKPWSKDYQ